MRTLRKPKYFKQLLFVGFLGLIVAFGILGGLYTRNQQKNAPKRSVEALKASLNESVLSVNALLAIDGSSEIAPESLVSTRYFLEQSIKRAQSQLETNNEVLGDDSPAISDQLKLQQDLLAEYDVAWGILGKAISYLPSIDLGSLNPSTDKDKLATRSTAAYNNLSKLSKTYGNRFSNETNNALNSSINCYAELNELVQQNNNALVTSVRDRCISGYSMTRKQLIGTVLETYNSTKSRNSISSLVDSINNL